MKHAKLEFAVGEMWLKRYDRVVGSKCNWVEMERERNMK